MRNVLAIISFLLLLSCSGDPELRRSIFINDPAAPGLPKYSEWGYNTFGAYYNRDVIVSNDYDVPVQVIKRSGNTSFVFQGRRSGQYTWGNYFSITLTIRNFSPTTYRDLVTLNQTIIDLEHPDYFIEITDVDSTVDFELLNGTFEIKRAQYLLVDEEPQEVILSGVFELQVVIDGEPISISEGRFDVGVGTYNFFVYE